MNFIPCNNSKISFELIDPSPQSTDGKLLLLLHGGSKTIGKDRFGYLQNKLAEANIASFAFDYSGVGSSPGVLEESSLAKRIEETLCVVEHVKKQYPQKEFTLYGVSMGGYIALAVIEKLSNLFEKLILHAPAAYAKEAHSLNFDKKFTEVLRRDSSWEDSLSFEWLKNFQGSVLFLIGENDPIIPREIIARYKNILEKKSITKLIAVPNMEHNIWNGKEQSEQHRVLISEYIATFIKK